MLRAFMTAPAAEKLPPPENLSARELFVFLWPFIRPYRGMLGLAVFLLVITIPFVQVHPLIWRHVADVVLPARDLRGLLWSLAIMFGAYLVGSVTGGIQGYLMERVGKSVTRSVREKIFTYLTHQTLAYHHDHNAGELVTRVVADVDSMQESVLNGLMNLLDEFLSFIWVAGICISLQPIVGTASTLPLIVSFFFIKAFNQRLKTHYDAVRKALGRIGEFVHDRLGGVQVVQGFALEKAECAKFAQRTEAHYSASMKAAILRNIFFPGIGLFGFASNMIMLGLGVWFIWKGQMTMGVLLAYRGYWWRLQSPIRTLAQTSDILQRARSAAQRVVGLLREPVLIQDAPGAAAWEPAREGGAALEFRDVRFGYLPGHEILHGVSFRVEPGEFVALAGQSGSGKTTILNLAARFFEPLAGEVLVDGRDYRGFTLASLRGHLAIVSQETYLFNETVRDNIRYPYPDRSDAAVEEAARAANAHEFIQHLPLGYETMTGLRGVKLSGGQKQRLSLARAFLASPALLLLDEPTSAVEPGSEKLIHEALARLSAGRTTLLVTHRVTLLQNAPRILFFADGELVADGSHEHLLATCPGYKRSYEEWQVEELAPLG
jgi:ATP-binding cassette subfamily B protein